MRLRIIIALSATLASACGPTQASTSECIVGPWLEPSTPACAGHSLCSSTAPPAECALQDCVVRGLVLYRADATYMKAPLLLSPQARQFSRATDGLGGVWTLEGSKVTIGSVTSLAECTKTTLLLGEAPYRAKTEKPEAGLVQAILSADQSMTWRAIKY